MAAGPNDLVTLAQAYAWLGIPPDTDDINLQFAISAYSQLIANWCSRNFVSASYSEVYDGHGGRRLMTKNWPITAVASLSVNGQAIAVATGVPGAGYSFNDRSVFLGSCDQYWRGLGNISISYTAGYSPVPLDLQMACLEWMKATYLNRQDAQEVASRRAGDTEEKYLSPITALASGQAAPMPPAVFAVLSQYRNVLPV
jgi:hypothetical protein